MKRPANARKLLERLRSLSESPQKIDPITDTDIISNVKNWIEKIWDNEGVNNPNFDIRPVKIPYSANVYRMDRAKLNSKKYNIIFQIESGKCKFFSIWKNTGKLKNIPIPSITQVLLWKDKTEARQGVSSYQVTKHILFPMTGGLLCDKQQTEEEHRAWNYIALTLGFELGNIVGVYDNLYKQFTEFLSWDEYNSEMPKFFGTSIENRRYQLCIIDSDRV